MTRGKPVATQGNLVDGMDDRSGRLLRIDDIADRLAISRSMAWKLVAIGELPAVRIGRAVRVRPGDLEAYVARAAEER
jgi:excisionase family DNA binding protein